MYSHASGVPLKEREPVGLDQDALDAAGAALDDEISDGSNSDYSFSDAPAVSN